MKDKYNDLFEELDADLQLKELKDERVIPTVIDIDSLKKEREMLELVLSNVLDMTYGVSYATSEELVHYLNSLVRRITDIFNSNDEEKINILLSGEFNKDIMYRGAEINEEKKKLPLYFILDLIIGVLENKNVDDYYKDSNAIKEVVSQLKEVRAKTSTLNFDDRFKPIEIIDDDTMNLIIENKGLFEIDVDRKNDFNYLVVRITKNNTRMPIYRSDKDKINEVEYEKTKKNRERLERIIKKYFKHGELPSIGRFKEELIAEDLNPSIKSALLSISVNKSKYIFLEDLADSVKPLLDRIEEVEERERKYDNELEKEEFNVEEDRESKITLARLRYRQKSALWKFFHKKLNPNNIDFNDMKEEEIDNLYRRR